MIPIIPRSLRPCASDVLESNSGVGFGLSVIFVSSVLGSSFAALIAVGVGDTVGVGAGTGATCGTAVGAVGTGVFVTGGGTGFDLPPEESSSSPLILKGRLDIRPSTVSPDTASVSAISSSEAPV